MSIMKNWEGLRIPFEKIDVATQKFKTCIGRGGYGWVYKGILSIDGKDTTVAVKRLNEQFGQGLKEFLTEIQLLSGQEHPNLISLVGYCDEGKEKIIVYEYAARGSLDRYIRRNRDESSTTLTWLERLNICVDAARGLDHLHNNIGGHRTIIHRDIKSSNILIDETGVAKISDLGLSKLSVAGFGMSLIVSNGCGTQGYCEPEYYNSGVVTKKSDVYSFGIVLFEVLCGRLCIIERDNGFILSGKSVKEYYNKGNLVKIIDPSLKEHIGSYSMTKFSEIAYRCLHDDREQRPTMDIVAKELKETLSVQHEKYEEGIDDDEHFEKKLPDDYERYIEMSDIPLNYTTKKELYLLFCRGFLANTGQLWFSTHKSTRGICSILPARCVLDSNILETLSPTESRFKEVKKLGSNLGYSFTCRLESYMFSLDHYKYACYLVFKVEDGYVWPIDGANFEAVSNLGGKAISVSILKLEEESGSSKSIYGKDISVIKQIRIKKPKEERGSSKSTEGKDISVIKPIRIKEPKEVRASSKTIDDKDICFMKPIRIKEPKEERASSKSTEGDKDISVIKPIRIKEPKEEESGLSKSIAGGWVDPKRSVVEKRDDGWLEARLTATLSKGYLENHKELKVTLWEFKRGSFNKMIVEGVEFRPVVVDESYVV